MEQERFLRDVMAAHGDMVYRLALCRMQNVQDAEAYIRTCSCGCSRSRTGTGTESI